MLCHKVTKRPCIRNRLSWMQQLNYHVLGILSWALSWSYLCKSASKVVAVSTLTLALWNQPDLTIAILDQASLTPSLFFISIHTVIETCALFCNCRIQMNAHLQAKRRKELFYSKLVIPSSRELSPLPWPINHYYTARKCFITECFKEWLAGSSLLVQRKTHNHSP